MKIAIEELNDLQSEFSKRVKNITAKLDTVKSKTEAITKLASFQGKAADKAKHYFQTVHGTSVDQLKNTVLHLEKNLSKMISEFHQTVDEASNAVITEEYLNDVNKKVQKTKNEMLATHHEGEQVIKSVADVIPLTAPDISRFIDRVNQSRKYIHDVNKKLLDFDRKALQIVNESKQEVDKVLKKISGYTANSLLAAGHSGGVNETDFEVRDKSEFSEEKMLALMIAGSKSFSKVLKNINKSNTYSTAAMQFYAYFKLDKKTRLLFRKYGTHAFTREQYRKFNNYLTSTVFKFKFKELMNHLKTYKTAAFTKENMKSLQNVIETFGKERGKLAMFREFDKLFGLEKYREFKKLSLGKKTLKMATTFGDEFVGKKYKATKKAIQSLPEWKDPKKAYKNAVETFKENTKDLNALGKTMKIAGKSLGVLGIGIAAADNYKTYKGDTQKTIVGTAVDTAFGAVAAATGAAVGSAFLPPIGTVAGAGVGMGVSYVANIKWGKPPKSTIEHTKELVNKGVDTVSKATKKIGRKIASWFK